jgi:hypothetical protein
VLASRVTRGADVLASSIDGAASVVITVIEGATRVAVGVIEGAAWVVTGVADMLASKAERAAAPRHDAPSTTNGETRGLPRGQSTVQPVDRSVNWSTCHATSRTVMQPTRPIEWPTGGPQVCNQ